MTESIVAGILRGAADLVEPKGAWTQGSLARDSDGHPTLAWGGEGVCFCAMGAIFKIGADNHENTNKAIRALESLVLGPVGGWNDQKSRKQPEVVAALREAAKMVEEKND